MYSLSLERPFLETTEVNKNIKEHEWEDKKDWLRGTLMVDVLVIKIFTGAWGMLTVFS